MIARCVLVLLSTLMLGMQTTYFQNYSTAYFRIRYEKSVSVEGIKKLGEELENKYAESRLRFGISLNNRVDVYVYSSPIKFRSDSRSVAFNDGAFRDGKIYLMSPKVLGTEMKLQSVVARLVTRAVLDEIKLCPPWLSECYSLYAGGDVSSFGRPARFKGSGFSDISEEFSTAEREKDVRELYAKLAVTANFLVNRYGEKKVEAMFEEFNTGLPIEEIFENSFNEKIGDIEKAWMSALKNSPNE